MLASVVQQGGMNYTLDSRLVASEFNAEFILILQVGGRVQVHGLGHRLGLSRRLRVWFVEGHVREVSHTQVM